ncbi:MAG: preprotein translocase subunit SecA [Patescibacteria group bacterium]|jgi:preprotein translocase subunit SecA|nr:preprotein translocase subunit SecA [Patescibacteria group bacterium]
MGILDKIFGDPNDKVIKEINTTVDKINAFEEEMKAKTDDELKAYTQKFRDKLSIKEGEKIEKEELRKKLDNILPEAFAVIREAAWRVIGQRPYDVQLVGGVALHRGQIAEMKTGEGKTLVASLALYLNALAGYGCHLITVNDYLSRMGAGWNAPVYHFLGISTGVIIHDKSLMYDPEFSDNEEFEEKLKHFRQVERGEAYKCDVLYGTNNEFGFDYLRDNMVPSLDRMVQRDLYFTIVDEVDSILIDEARTPLIISAPAEESTDKYFQFADLVKKLKEDVDYNIDEKMRTSTLSEEGITKMEKMLGVENIYTTAGVREVHHIEQALKAHAIFKRDKDYVVKDDEVIIVDEFTGRMMPGRRYSEGLHQAIEAKEGVKIQRESQTLATITFQNYFRMYDKLAGMTGTAVTEAEEFSKIYGLETVIIPTNKPIKRDDKNDLIYKTEEAKYMAVIEDIRERQKKGQPVLVGTISIEKNEYLLALMEREGLRPSALNAKNHAREARIIADAGKVGSVTIATNMAGRGVDIMLGGTELKKDDPEYADWKIQHEKVLELGGLHVIGTERHEARRIDNQLRGRAGRQGDAGSSQFFVSMEDDLMRVFGGDKMKNIMTTLRVPDDMPIENKMISRSIESAQKKVEGNNFDIRKHLVEYDDVINKHRESIYSKRKNILVSSESEDNKDVLSDTVLEMVENEIEQVVSFHTVSEYIKEWDVGEIYQVASTIFKVNDESKKELVSNKEETPKLDKANIRTEIIESLVKQAKERYTEIKKSADGFGLDWSSIEKSVLIRSYDTLWIEHLEAMSSVRQGIGLRGYGQRDPLVEYKKEGYILYNELNSLIQKEVVYSIYKVGQIDDVVSKGFTAPSLIDRATQFSAPAKTMSKGDMGGAQIIKQKERNEAGEKVGRNDDCPCGSGKKYKKCCGA